MSLESIAQILHLKRSGRDWVGACPSCGYRAGFSVTERDGRLLCYCAVGGCDWPSISAALIKRGLLDDRRELKRSRRRSTRIIPPPLEPTTIPHEGQNNWQAAGSIWRTSKPAVGTLVEAYLRSRGIDCTLPETIRFVSSLSHRTGHFGPGMVALIEHAEHGHVAIHRTWLKSDGSGKADCDPCKMTLGPRGGGACRLAPIGAEFGDLAVGEGIESCLSFHILTGAPVWSAISADGIADLILPPNIKHVGIVADNDAVGLNKAEAAARRWAGEGRRVRIAVPPEGRDFNDVLRANRGIG